MTAHSETPWVGRKDGRYNTQHSYDISNDDEPSIGYAPITDANGKVIAFVVDTDWPGKLDENVRRIVACVNYCAGLDTDGMETAVTIGDAAAAMRDRLLEKQLELISEREQLLAAAIDLMAQIDRPGIVKHYHPEADRLRAAIAAVKGGAA